MKKVSRNDRCGIPFYVLNQHILSAVRKQEFLGQKVLCRYSRQEYIKNQLQEDQIADQVSIKEYVDPLQEA